MCIVSTSRIGYKGDDGLDITVKSATGIGRVLAPTWELVGGVKGWRGYKRLTVEEYTELYYRLLHNRFRADDQAFLEILQRERVSLLCYCAAGSFCHRQLAAVVLSKIAQARGIPFMFSAESGTKS